MTPEGTRERSGQFREVNFACSGDGEGTVSGSLASRSIFCDSALEVRL